MRKDVAVLVSTAGRPVTKMYDILNVTPLS